MICIVDANHQRFPSQNGEWLHLCGGANTAWHLAGKRQCVGCAYLCGFIFHTRWVEHVGVTRPLSSEIGPGDGTKGGSPPNGPQTAHLLWVGPFAFTDENTREMEQRQFNLNKTLWQSFHPNLQTVFFRPHPPSNTWPAPNCTNIEQLAGECSSATGKLRDFSTGLNTVAVVCTKPDIKKNISH